MPTPRCLRRAGWLVAATLLGCGGSPSTDPAPKPNAGHEPAGGKTEEASAAAKPAFDEDARLEAALKDKRAERDAHADYKADEERTRKAAEEAAARAGEASGGDAADATSSPGSGIRCEQEGTDPPGCTIGKSSLDALLADPAVLARQGRFVPAMRDGKMIGFKVFAVRPDSVPARLTLKAGDTLLSINEHALTSVEAAEAAIAKLGDAKRLDIQLEREGKPQRLRVDVVP